MTGQQQPIQSISLSVRYFLDEQGGDRNIATRNFSAGDYIAIGLTYASGNTIEGNTITV